MKIGLKTRNFLASNILKNSFVLNKIYNQIYIFKNKKFFLDEVFKRKTLSLFDFKELSAEMPFCPLEFVKDTNFYGYAHSIKKYTGLDRLNCSMEHGLYYVDDYMPTATYSRTITKVITLNERRKKLIEGLTDKPALAIGPYIYYAESLLTEEEKLAIKEKYGRILLFFPQHGTVEDCVSYDIKRNIEELVVLKKVFHFDSVFVNMFYFDVLYTQYAEEYEKAGFKITTAGHRYDLNFISRLKSIIELADATASNAFGTNIGFSIFLQKPFLYIHSDSIVSDNTMVSEVLTSFMDYNINISEQQYSVVSKYWGFDCIKTPEQIKDFCNSL